MLMCSTVLIARALLCAMSLKGLRFLLAAGLKIPKRKLMSSTYHNINTWVLGVPGLA